MSRVLSAWGARAPGIAALWMASVFFLSPGPPAWAAGACPKCGHSPCICGGGQQGRTGGTRRQGGGMGGGFGLSVDLSGLFQHKPKAKAPGTSEAKAHDDDEIIKPKKPKKPQDDAIAEGCPLVGKPVYDEDCTWRIWKVMRVSRPSGKSDKEWDEEMLKYGRENLPDTGGHILGAKVNSISKVNELMNDENKLDKVGLDRGERILVLAVCIGKGGYVEQERVFEFNKLDPFRIRNLSSLDKYTDFHNKRLEAFKELEKELNTPRGK